MAQENTARVIEIAATEQPQDIRLRVAAYARVSSSSDEQLNSFAAQNRYYTELISGKDNWQLVDIYADEGITGTSIEKRDDFKRMLRDCERGLIDRILVKSISRFARNTTECLETVRSLKARGVSVYFEKEGIDTGKVSGEMLTAVFASLAQAESQSISGNMRWGLRKRMQAGTYLAPSTPFGYKIQGGEYIIVPNEAEIVRYIFESYVSGIGMDAIAAKLNTLDNPSPEQVRPYWHSTTILYILSNESYIGNSLWQKTYATNTLPTKQVKNTGALPMYRVLDTHPAIISQELFDAAQKLRSSRSKSNGKHPVCDDMRGKLICRECGTQMQPKLVNGQMYWVCRRHNRSKELCPLPPIADATVKEAFRILHFKLKKHPEILSKTAATLTELRNRRMLWSPDIIELNKKISDILSQNQMLAVLKQQGLVDPDIFISKTNELAEQLRKLKLEKEHLLDSETDDPLSQTRHIIKILRDSPDFLEYHDEELFSELIENVIVKSRTDVRFRLKNGLELDEHIGRTLS